MMITKRYSFIVAFCCAVFLLSVPVFVVANATSAETVEQTSSPKVDIFLGDWQRTDGGYRIIVSEIKKDGAAKVEYLNPRPINVAKAYVKTQKDYRKLYIEFQDKGYEGSTYTLYYYDKQDALVGFYYQAPMKQKYEVIFLRTKQ